jgi:hypothetical protein
MVRNSGFRGRYNAQRLVNPAKVIVHAVKRDAPKVIINFLREGVLTQFGSGGCKWLPALKTGGLYKTQQPPGRTVL